MAPSPGSAAPAAAAEGEAQEASEERRSLATMSRFEASDSPVDILVSQCSGLPGGPTSNRLIFIVSAGSPAPRTTQEKPHRRARGMCGRGGRPGGGDAKEPHIYILRLIFIAAMRGPRALSRPTDPGTSTWPCKHGEITVCLAAARAHASCYFRPSATAAPPPRSRPAAHPSPTPAAPLPCPEPAAATRAAAAAYTHMHSHTHTLHAHNTHDYTPPCCFITTSGP